MKVVILSANSYKDNDCIISAIDNDNYYTLIARGINKPTSKLTSLINVPTYADIDIKQSRKTKYYSIESANIIFSCMEMMNSYEDMLWLLILVQVINKCLNDEEKPLIFDALVRTLYSIKNNFNKEISILSLLAKILKIAGFEIVVDSCHNCNRKDQIIAFNINEGGFICKNCYKDETIYNKEQLIILHDVFKDFYFNKNKYSVNEDDFKSFSKLIIQFIEDNFDIKIENYSLLYE